MSKWKAMGVIRVVVSWFRRVRPGRIEDEIFVRRQVVLVCEEKEEIPGDVK